MQLLSPRKQPEDHRPLRPHPGRGAGKEVVARLELEESGTVTDQVIKGKDHVPGIAGLDHFSILSQFKVDPAGDRPADRQRVTPLRNDQRPWRSPRVPFFL